MKMKKIYLYRTLKLLLWCSGFCILFMHLTALLQPKYFYNSVSESPETEHWKAFYEEPQNSIDTIFLGSSHVYDGINPLVFYEETGLTSFDLSSSSQDLPTAYFYLQEALRYQKPKYVIFDAYGLLATAFSNEASYKRSLDNMRWSPVKLNAIREWQKYLKNEELLPRIFTLLDYHSRWDSLGREDFFPNEFMTSINGYCPVSSSAEDITHNSYNLYTNLPPLDETNLAYFDKLLDLCYRNDISFILIAIPDTIWTAGYCSAIQEVINDKDVPFIDYNTDKNYSAIGINDSTDWYNKNHLNVHGSAKFTLHLAKDLSEKGLLSIPEKKSEYDTLWQEKLKKNAF